MSTVGFPKKDFSATRLLVTHHDGPLGGWSLFTVLLALKDFSATRLLVTHHDGTLGGWSLFTVLLALLRLLQPDSMGIACAGLRC